MDPQVKAECEDGVTSFTDSELTSIVTYETRSADSIKAFTQSDAHMSQETIQTIFAAARSWGEAINALVADLNPDSADPISQAGQRYIQLQAQLNSSLFRQFTTDLIASRVS